MTYRNTLNSNKKLFNFDNGGECQFFQDSVLILKTGLNSNVPIVTDLTGKSVTTKDKLKGLNFDYGVKTEVVGSCGITFQGIFYIFGGKNLKKQISVVKLCELERLSTVELTHNFERGACTVGNGKIYLCFNAEVRLRQKTCYVSDKPESNFAANITESYHEHRLIRIASSESK